MDDLQGLRAPPALVALEKARAAVGFALASEPRTGALLRTLATSKPGGQLLEIGTGTGLGTAWLLDGMDETARLTSLERDPTWHAVAQDHLGGDPRVTLVCGDALDWLQGCSLSFDLIFADSFVGKMEHLDLALDLPAPGGLYIGDDLLPQANWPDGHGARVTVLLAALEDDPRLTVLRLAWAAGLVVAARKP